MRVLFIYFIISLLFGINAFGATLKAYGSIPSITNMIYILNPKSMIGLNYKPYKEDLIFLLEEVANLPVLGMLGGGKEANLEMIISQKPNIVFSSFDMKSSFKSIEKTLNKFNIQVVYLKVNNINDMLDSLLVMGEVLGYKERALKLKGWAESILKDIVIEPEYRPRIYFAQGVDGLKSECGDNSINDVAKIIGGENIIKCGSVNGVKNRQISINIELVIERNPEIIFVREVALYNEFKNSPNAKWQGILALKNNNIYYAPSSPSNWLSRPPSLMRVIGFPWAFSIVHPEIKLAQNININEKIKEFYKLFLHYDNLNDKDIEKLLQGE